MQHSLRKSLRQPIMIRIYFEQKNCRVLSGRRLIIYKNAVPNFKKQSESAKQARCKVQAA